MGIDEEKVIIRTSDRLTFKRCRQQWDFGSKIRQNWEPLIRPLPLDFGVAIHAGLQEYYEPDFWTGDRSMIQLVAKEVFRDLCRVHRNDYLEAMHVDDMDPQIEQEQYYEPMELGLGMLDHYFQWAPTVDNFQPKLVEIEFEVPIPGPNGRDLYWHGMPVVYQGRVDLLVEDQFGRYWIVDHKTAAQFGSVEYLEMDEQCGSYIWALKKMLNLPIAGVIYNRLLKAVPKGPVPLQRGGFSVNKQQRTTYEVFKKGLLEAGENPSHYIDFLEYLQDQGNKFFQRIQVSRSSTEINNLERQIGLEAIDMLNDPSIYPSVGMFNCMGCAYRPPCLAKLDGSDYGFILNETFRKRPQAEEVLVDDGT